MNTKIKSLLAIGVLSLALGSLQAQIFNIGTTNANLTVDTNWVAIPYGIYDTTDKQWGFGGAVLYQVSPYFWTGVRTDWLSGQRATAGVSAQLQVTETIAGISVTPFATSSVGIGSSTLYGSAGAGAAVKFHEWDFKISSHSFQLSAGAVADWEHVVNNNRSYNQIVGGPLLQLVF